MIGFLPKFQRNFELTIFKLPFLTCSKYYKYLFIQIISYSNFTNQSKLIQVVKQDHTLLSEAKFLMTLNRFNGYKCVIYVMILDDSVYSMLGDCHILWSCKGTCNTFFHVLQIPFKFSLILTLNFYCLLV